MRQGLHKYSPQNSRQSMNGDCDAADAGGDEEDNQVLGGGMGAL